MSVADLVSCRVRAFVRTMSTKFGEEQVDLSRIHFQMWGSGVSVRSCALSLEKTLKVLFCLVFGVRKTDKKIFVKQGDKEVVYEDDGFGTVYGAIQTFFCHRVLVVRPNYNFVPGSVYEKGRYDIKQSLEECFDEELFENKVLPTLATEEQSTWREFLTYPVKEQELMKWSFLSDLFTAYRTGLRAPPAGFGEDEPTEYTTPSKWMATYEDEESEVDPFGIAVRALTVRKSLLASVISAAKEADQFCRTQIFGKYTYVLFTEPPKDLFSVIKTVGGCPDLAWINFQPGAITVDSDASLPVKPKEKDVGNGGEKSVKKSWADESESFTTITGKSEGLSDICIRLKKRIADNLKINQMSEEKKAIVRFGSTKGQTFYEQLSASGKRKVGTCVKNGNVVDNVARLVEFFKGYGDELTEEEFEDLALSRLAVMNVKVHSNCTLTKP